MKNVMRKLRHWAQAVSDILVPRTCLACGERLLLGERYLCLHCLADMPLTYFWNRKHNRMADKFNDILQKNMDLGRMAFEPYVFACSLFFYSNDARYRLILYDLKYNGNTDIGIFFSRRLGMRMAGCSWLRNADAIIPVPLHWRRKWSRGYNQAEIIARGIGQEMGVEVRTDVLFRKRMTRTQTKLSVEEKAQNVSGAFDVTLPEDWLMLNGSLKVRHLILVDDLFTTGSTLYACYAALRSVFPPSVRISVATLGFVGRA